MGRSMTHWRLSRRSGDAEIHPTGSRGADTQRAPNLLSFRPRQTTANSLPPTSEGLITSRSFIPAQSLLDEIQEAESRLDDLELGTRVFLISCLTIIVLFLAAAGLVVGALT